MKIAMTHSDLPNESKGGVAFQAHYLANALQERGHDVTMFTFSRAFEECRYRVTTLPLSRRMLRFQGLVLAVLLRRIDFSGYSVVHTHGDNWLMRRAHPQIRTFYGSAYDEARSATSMKRRVFQRLVYQMELAGSRVADVNVGISRATQMRIPRVTRIIPCGVDISRFAPAALSEKSKAPSILFVGTASGRKRGQFLADTFARAVVPAVPNAELWTVADAEIRGPGVINHGKVNLDKLTDLYRRAWVFCLPSTYEGFGVPYIEAMASGTPVVASPNLGAREVLEEGKVGILSSDADLGAILTRLLQDSALRADLASSGLDCSQRYAWPRIVEQYEHIYEGLIA